VAVATTGHGHFYVNAVRYPPGVDFFLAKFNSLEITPPTSSNAIPEALELLIPYPMPGSSEGGLM
jgi:hypothetical protein